MKCFALSSKGDLHKGIKFHVTTDEHVGQIFHLCADESYAGELPPCVALTNDHINDLVMTSKTEGRVFDVEKQDGVLIMIQHQFSPISRYMATTRIDGPAHHIRDMRKSDKLPPILSLWYLAPGSRLKIDETFLEVDDNGRPSWNKLGIIT